MALEYLNRNKTKAHYESTSFTQPQSQRYASEMSLMQTSRTKDVRKRLPKFEKLSKSIHAESFREKMKTSMAELHTRDCS